MMNYVFGGMIIAAFLSSIFSGNTEALAEGALNGAGESVELLLTIAGMLGLWSGIMEIASRGGLTALIGRLLEPALRRLFPSVGRGSPVMRDICMNVSANLLGMGNAATPFGISAMRGLKRLSPRKDEASGDMVTFVVINTASIQLMPTMMGALRQSYGSKTPFDVLPCVWISSVCALAVGLSLSFILRR